MGIHKKIRVLIVDDSLIFREVLARGIASDPDIEVVGKAIDPFDARDKILALQPDVMTCDVEMPKMNGIEFIRRLLPQYPLPVIVVSAISNAVFDAMNAGAVDFVTKPDVQSPKGVEGFIVELIAKIKVVANAKVGQTVNKPANYEPQLQTSEHKKTTVDSVQTSRFDPNKVIAIGASTGGTEALFSILKHLPPSVPGIVIVQHIPPVFSTMFAERLNNQTRLRVKEAETGDYVEPGLVLIAPGDQHMRVKKVADKYKVEVFHGEKVSGHCPSVDVLFDSVAKEVGNQAIGIILTGMGYDGAKGLLAMKRKGARTIGQDEQSSIVYGMPKVSYEIGAVERQMPLQTIPQMLLAMTR
ncbi:chemotaxis response regulator protein-glutamate methylesterase [Desulfuribacillus stibiiarsenatis]|uniref:Protein-glutamate methylesterase/protein-glutamine glutaminase n=1 Tax=Desulfuribacillus stibiiarsenatis TaxID=1390249 RepID=A0A1E5L457_9FIRM|nr:chemotaxis response regulator protein-glutamate methylesterase [Desulfuribacillus stibiiarsenatis]OEH84871.1 chemotaxis response regulator protein-glutamate methylesterase [Desulfuribacillus stibiiarsenatis]